MNTCEDGPFGAAGIAARHVYHDLSVPLLVEHALARKEGFLTADGAFCATTGKYTGRSPGDKFVVRDPEVEPHVAWGPVNQPMAPAAFDRLYERMVAYMKDRDVYVFNGYAGADPLYQMPIRVVTEYAWHNLFARQLFIRPTAPPQGHQPHFTVLNCPGVLADPAVDGTRSEAFILLSFTRRIVLIGGTEYAGEIKKSIFTALNYLLPEQGVFPMHCSANLGEAGDVALFFGLSGTGKTTISADPQRRLIGDDEHGWSDTGVFNFEGGCYAKTIGLRAEHEPQIWNAIRFGTVLENVVTDPATRLPDYDSAALTENTRAAYPVDFIPGALIPAVAGHPQAIVFLTADASGVLPPVARLTREQAMFHFLSGYTSKLAGTERGVTTPEATFSTCFGAPFLPRPPITYAQMLGERVDRVGARVYLVNTGWTGGPYGIGQRMQLAHTRAMVAAALTGHLEDGGLDPDPVFGVLVPRYCPGVPPHVLRPRAIWPDPGAYDEQARHLAGLFRQNFGKFRGVPPEVAAAGPAAG